MSILFTKQFQEVSTDPRNSAVQQIMGNLYLN